MSSMEKDSESEAVGERLSDKTGLSEREGYQAQALLPLCEKKQIRYTDHAQNPCFQKGVCMGP